MKDKDILFTAATYTRLTVESSFSRLHDDNFQTLPARLPARQCHSGGDRQFTLYISNLFAAMSCNVVFYLPYKQKTLTIKSVFYRLYNLYSEDIYLLSLEIYKPIVG